jgi:lysophospholipase L1-like esterase
LGHNDENSLTAAHFKTNITKFVTEAKAKGAIPVLVTSVTSRRFDSAGRVLDNHSFVPVIYEIAIAQNVPVIKLYETSKALVQSAGVEGSKQLYLYTTPGQYPGYPSGISDSTHFQEPGAGKIADLVIAEINRLNLPGLSNSSTRQ